MDFVPILVLDHGYVGLVESWGSDERIIEAARMSTAKGFQDWNTDAKLLAYLYKNKHMTPFEMCGMVLEIKAPVFVFREWHRHRTQSYNEMSARYIPLPNENYVPSAQRILQSGGVNKQAQGMKPVTLEEATEFGRRLRGMYEEVEFEYQRALEAGIPKELARLMLPVGRYSRMRASANLRNWLQFLELRMASNAQQEIREYAGAVHAILQGQFPRTAMLFDGVSLPQGS